MIVIKKYNINAIVEIIEVAKTIYSTKVFDETNIDDQTRFLRMCMRDGNYSIFTHVGATVEITCSRCVMDELVSSNFNITIKRQDMNNNSFNFFPPSEILESVQLMSIFNDYVKNINKTVISMMKINDKIDYTYILPGCASTNILLTTNFLEWIRILKLGNYKKTSDELRKICEFLYNEFHKIYPQVFNKMMLKSKIDMD